jgi:D-glycero-D-manno-heptose 1,7-bisphosphate phosphatase
MSRYRWAQAREFQGRSRCAVFIDKDGTLIEDVPYNVEPALLCFQPDSLMALSLLAAHGYALVVVTNQSGLGLGYFTRAQLKVLQTVLQDRLREEAGIELLDFVVCPHAPGNDGRPMCRCRKPAPGMLLRAARQHRLSLAHSWMVGDTLDDVEAGHRAGCRSVLFNSGGETVWRQSALRKPNAVCTHWSEITHFILRADAATHAPKFLEARP